MTIQKFKLHGSTYKVKDDTYYNEDTSDDMIERLENIRQNKKRVQFRWGDTKTGEDWGDMYDVEGTIGRSMGPVKIPLLIHSQRSMGGGGILTGNIVKIMESKGKRTIYSHPKYHLKDELREMVKKNKSMQKAYKRLGVM